MRAMRAMRSGKHNQHVLAEHSKIPIWNIPVGPQSLGSTRFPWRRNSTASQTRPMRGMFYFNNSPKFEQNDLLQ
jgi:hypothetical protein